MVEVTWAKFQGPTSIDRALVPQQKTKKTFQPELRKLLYFNMALISYLLETAYVDTGNSFSFPILVMYSASRFFADFLFWLTLWNNSQCCGKRS